MSLAFIPEKDFPYAIRKIEYTLSQTGKQGYFRNRENQKLHYEAYTAPGSRRTVVIVHGLSEFTKKYYELTWYLLSAGYNVFLYDQRGHGLSHRDTDRPELIHIPGMDALVEDLEDFLQQVVLPADPGTLYLYAHSMGGAVGLLHLARYPGSFRRALISSPLFRPSTAGFPGWIFHFTTGIRRALGQGTEKFVFSREFVPDSPYIHRAGDSESRVRHSLSWRAHYREYQSTPMTVDCINACLAAQKQLLAKEVTAGIQTPVLMLCAGGDTLVKLPPQGKFASRCPACERIVYPEANHCLLTDEDAVVKETVERTLAHFAG